MNRKILWVDDEIDRLEPHILFLEEKGYTLQTCKSGTEAIEVLDTEQFDLVILDENMPGISGLETLDRLKKKLPNIAVMMVTKNDEEEIHESAIGGKITDFLIKPITPKQVFFSLKKYFNEKVLVSEKTTQNYLQEFNNLSQTLQTLQTPKEWADYYEQLVYWELDLERSANADLLEIFYSQKQSANNDFFKFIEKNYTDWFSKSAEETPLLSHRVFDEVIKQKLDQTTLLIVIDNLRLDHWRKIEPHISQHFRKEQEHLYFSILPTSTQYCRNALFSGLTPLDIQNKLPNMWVGDFDEGRGNEYESELLALQMKRFGLEPIKKIHKVTSLKTGKDIGDKLKNNDNKLFALVYNFMDILSHSKNEIAFLKELAVNEKSYRDIVESWFVNSLLFDTIKLGKELGYQLIITTDHGSINVKKDTKVIGIKETSRNLRYKTGKNISYDKKSVFEVKKGTNIALPSNDSFIFAKPQDYFIYPNRYNHYAELYRNSYQHGGVSMEEMIVPIAFFTPQT